MTIMQIDCVNIYSMMKDIKVFQMFPSGKNGNDKHYPPCHFYHSRQSFIC